MPTDNGDCQGNIQQFRSNMRSSIYIYTENGFCSEVGGGRLGTGLQALNIEQACGVIYEHRGISYTLRRNACNLLLQFLCAMIFEV
jgi:hypothetical protein